MVGMGAGETCPCVANWAQAAAMLAAGAFDSIFFIVHYLGIPFYSFITFFIW